LDKEDGSSRKVLSAQQAEDLKLKEKRKREREVRSVSQSCCAYRSVCFVTYEMYIRLPVFFVCLMEISSMQKNLPRKKRRKLEAAREMLEDDEQDDKPRVSTPFTC
jgi:ATP-dependent RNA helicase DDX27